MTTGSRITGRRTGHSGVAARLAAAAGIAASGWLGAGSAASAAPAVATDIPPVHSLVARVMEGVGEPALIVPPGASPHGYAMRPSEAASLDRAAVVFWIGEALTPWLGEAVESLAADAVSVELSEVEGITRLPFRTGARFEGHDHGDGHGHGHGHGHDHAKKDDHGHSHGHSHGHAKKDDHGHSHAKKDDHGHGHSHGHGHDHGDAAFDEHLWLDPANARAWLAAIATALAAADPANAALYRANAEAGQAELAALEDELDQVLDPVRGEGFIVFHDAYQYFEARFGIPASGAITLGDARQPSAQRIAEIRDVIAETDARCVFAEPQFEPKLVDTVIEGTGARAGVLDPLGAALPAGPTLYPALVRGLAASLAECLSAPVPG